MTAGKRRVLIPPLRQGPAVQTGPVAVIEWHGLAMGSEWRVRALAGARHAGRQAALGRGIESRIMAVVRQMSHYEPGSDLCRFNDAAPESWFRLPDEFFRVLDQALRVAAASRGWFDPALGRGVSQCGFGPPAGPPQQSVGRRQPGPSWRALRLDPARRAAWQPGGVQLNLSGIAKGFAVDLVADYLRRQGVAAALVDIGGELAGFGIKPDGTPWWVAIEDPPEAAGTPPCLIALPACAVASSGHWRQCRVEAGERISHLLDPATGRPARTRTEAATVLHESCMLADAWATALCVAPPEVAMELARREGLAARLLVRGKDAPWQEWLSPALAAMEE